MFAKENPDYSRFSVRLEVFVKYFVQHFEAKLQIYHLILEGEIEKAGKFTDRFSSILGIGLGGAAVGILGLCSGTPIPFASRIVKTGASGVKYAGKKIGIEKSTKKAIDLKDLIDAFQNDKKKFRLELVRAGVDVFQSFELQFMRVDTEKGPKYAMKQLAMDASNRALDYYLQKRNDSIAEGVLLGGSKMEPILGVPVFSKIFNTYGLEIIYKGLSSEEKWRTGFLYEKTGVVTEGKNPGEMIYYDKKDGKSESNKYGYRRLLTSENWENLKGDYNKSSDLSKSKNFTDYYYNLSSKQVEEKSKEILTKINRFDNVLGEETLTELITEFKDGVMKNLRLLREDFEKDFKVLGNIEANLQNLNCDEYLKKIVDQSSEQMNQGLKETQELVMEGQERIVGSVHEMKREARFHHEENIKFHSKSQSEMAKVVGGIGDIKEKLKEMSERKKSSKKKSLWFKVEESVSLFTGRKRQLKQVSTAIHQGMIVITGLDGVGKSELAIKYARDEYNEKDSVIWIDAETNETAKKSFDVLSKILRMETDDADAEEEKRKSVILEVCKRYSEGRILLIFDNAENLKKIEKILPSGLPNNSKKPCVLVTSPNNLDWTSRRLNIKNLPLNDFTDPEAIEFIKNFLEFKDDSQDEDIKTLAKELHNFPLALHQAVSYIKDMNEAYQHRKLEFKVSDYLKEYKVKPKKLLNQGIDNDNRFITMFNSLQVTLDKINEDSFGKKSLIMLNIISYFAPGNIPENMFLNELAGGDLNELIPITRLLVKYSIVSLEKGMLRVHGLVQHVRRLDLAERKEEEEILAKGLILLKEHIRDGKDIRCYSPHISSAWNYARKHDKLIERFIVKDVDDKTASTSFLHVIAEASSYEVVESIIEKVEQNYPNELNKAINAKDKENGIPLHNAASNGDERVMNLLIEKGADVNAKNTQSWTPLHLASRNGYLVAVNRLLDKKADVDDLTGYKYTALHLASRNGYPEIGKVLINKNADINAEDQRKFTPLHFAAKKNHYEVVQTLLKNDNINVNAETEDKFTPLHFAAKEGNSEIVDALLENETKKKAEDELTPLRSVAPREKLKFQMNWSTNIELNVNAETANGFTPLHFAARNGCSNIVKALLHKNADVNAKDRFNFTPLHFAVKMNHDKVVEILLEDVKVNVNAETMYNITPLHFAAKEGNTNIVNALLAKGASVNKKNKDSFTPLHYAAMKNHMEVVRELLKKSEIDLNAKTTKSKTALHFAVQDGYSEIVKALIDKDADLNTEDQCKLTPLHLSVKNGHSEIVKLLLRKGAKINKKDKDDFTPLHYAALRNHEEVVKELLRNSEIDVNAETAKGDTALHLAAEKNNLEVVKDLIARNANVNMKNNDGFTALDLAHSKNYLEVSNYISQYEVKEEVSINGNRTEEN